MKLLFISSEEDCFFLIRKMLRDCYVFCANDIDNGLDLAKRENPDGMIVDCEVLYERGVEDIYRILENFDKHVIVWALRFFIEENGSKVKGERITFVDKLSGDLSTKVSKVIQPL